MRQLSQTIERQNAVLDQAAQRGEIGRLAWFVEVYAADKRFRGSDGKRYFCLEYPKPLVPTIPITGDGVAERIAVELLVLLAEEANAGKRLEFYPALCWVDQTAEEPYFRYGDLAQPDIICATCGGVRKQPVAHDETVPVVCPNCGADMGYLYSKNR